MDTQEFPHTSGSFRSKYRPAQRRTEQFLLLLPDSHNPSLQAFRNACSRTKTNGFSYPSHFTFLLFINLLYSKHTTRQPSAHCAQLHSHWAGESPDSREGLTNSRSTSSLPQIFLFACDSSLKEWTPKSAHAFPTQTTCITSTR